MDLSLDGGAPPPEAAANDLGGTAGGPRPWGPLDLLELRATAAMLAGPRWRDLLDGRDDAGFGEAAYREAPVAGYDAGWLEAMEGWWRSKAPQGQSPEEAVVAAGDPELARKLGLAFHRRRFDLGLRPWREKRPRPSGPAARRGDGG